ncbi:MAG: hypothetical protein HUU20_04460 [Pirellulales bacterium]|nr:hypothetical protein [Pirellulales bacterium]
MKSNRPAHGRRVQQAAERGYAALFLLYLWSPIAAASVGNYVTRQVTFAVGLSDEWCRKRRRTLGMAGAISVVSLAAVAYGTNLIGRGVDAGMWVVSLGILCTLGSLLYGLNASTLVAAKRITNDCFWLRGIHPDFLAELPEWRGELRGDLPSSLGVNE